MLKSLVIKNFALIDKLDIDFSNGLSVITGETGAGKSIILGALSLILGQRADVKSIMINAEKCTVEGHFDIAKYDLKSFFEERDWEYEGETCIIRREIFTNGKSRSFINDSPVNLIDLKLLGEQLIDIHSQHQNLSLNDNHFQLSVIDALAKTQEIYTEYKKSYQSYIEAEKVFNKAQSEVQKNKEEEDYLHFQFQTLSDAKLRVGEQEELENELKEISHAEEIKSSLFTIIQSLSGEGENAESLLKKSVDAAQNLQSVYTKSKEIGERLQSLYIELNDIRLETERHFEEIEFNPVRLQEVEDRLSQIYDLENKYGADSVQELLNLQDEIASKLENIGHSDKRLHELEKDMLEKKQEMNNFAEKLSIKRKSVIPFVENQLIEKLHYLGMPNVRFECKSEEKISDITGKDSIQFLFSANKKVPLQPISQIASGGEISRFMLCIKSMIAGAMELPTIIFDEIDTGTSGEIADKMGEIMQEMSKDMQVIVITHLPQIASKGNTHYKVYKTDDAETTHTTMVKLDTEQRITEIARMLSGAEISQQAIENAKVMLNNEHQAVYSK